MMKSFQRLSFIGKTVACIFIVITLTVLFDGGSWIGVIITAVVVYLLIKPFMPKSDEHKPVEESDEDSHSRLQQDDDNYSHLKEEEERVNQENIANQEALDRLL